MCSVALLWCSGRGQSIDARGGPAFLCVRMSATKNTNGGAKGLTRSAWIRQQPQNVKAAELVAKAKTEGVDINVGLVHQVRSKWREHEARMKASNPGVRKANEFSIPPSVVARTRSSARGVDAAADEEVEFRRLVLNIGLARAQECVAEVEKAVLDELGL